MAVYLNTFECWEAYGGPEEGGWWYTCGSPVQSVLVSQDNLDDWLKATPIKQRSEMLRHATMMYTKGQAPTPARTGYGGYTFVVGSDEPSSYREDNDYRSWFEDHYAEPFPAERPYYE